MGFVFSSNLGGSFVSSIVSDEVYDPVYDTPMDGELVFKVLFSFYRNLMTDQEIFTTYWSGLMQQVAGDLLNLWTVGYAGNLRDVPVISQRKWVQLDLIVDVDFTEDPGFTQVGVGSEDISYSSTLQVLEGTWTNRARLDKTYLALKGEVTEDASLSFSFKAELSEVQTRGTLLVGYLGATDELKNALVVGITGDATTVDTPTAGLMHFDENGNVTVAFSGLALEIDAEYEFDASYTANSGVAILTIYDLHYSKASGTDGATGEGEVGDTLTNVFSSPLVNFETAGVMAGDVLTIMGVDYEIIEVSGGTLTTKVIGLPIDTSGLTFEVTGKNLISSASLDLPGDASIPTFVCTQFGTCNLDLRVAGSQIFVSPGLGNRKQLTAKIWGMSYMDPTFDTRVITIPRLQDVVTEPTSILMEGTDYRIVDSTILFQEPPPEGLWAEYVGYDEYYIRDNFGTNVGLLAESSDQYKARVRGLYYDYFRGPTVSALEQGVHILIGLPIADKAGVVEVVNLAYSGVFGLITVAGEDYLFPAIVGTDLQVGDMVETFQPLCRGVEVIDYKVDPEWFVNLSFDEIKKFHTFLVKLDIDAFTGDTLALAATFVGQNKPTWKDYLFVLFKQLQDDLTPSDVLSFLMTLDLWDTPGDSFVVTYDGNDYGESEADWKYSQGLTDWDETSPAMRATAAPLTGLATFNNTSTAVTGTGTVFTSDIGGPGAVVDKYLAVGRYTNGNDGETTLGSNVLVDSSGSAFADAQIGDQITVAGEGTFEIIIVDPSFDSVTLDSPMTATNVGVDWYVVGQLLIWGQVASVTNDTALVLSTAFEGTSGVYVMALLDTAYKEVFYDQFQEAVPDEELTFVATIAPAYVGALPLAIDLPDSQTTTQSLQFTNYSGGGAGDTVESTVAELVP